LNGRLFGRVAVRFGLLICNSTSCPDIFNKTKPTPCAAADDRKSYSTRVTYEGYLQKWILPRWRACRLADVKAVEVEKWLKSLCFPENRHFNLHVTAKRKSETGKQPYWPGMLWRYYGKPALKRAGVTKQVSYHTFRHTFGTLLNANGENPKVVQELLRHASLKVTTDVYMQAVSPQSAKHRTTWSDW
jgi:integrase